MLFNLKSSFLLGVLALSTAEACLTVKARVSADIEVLSNIEINDNDRIKCSSPNQSGQKDCEGHPGYGMKWSKIATNKKTIDVEWRTPHGTYNIQVKDPVCNTQNCCSRKIALLFC